MRAEVAEEALFSGNNCWQPRAGQTNDAKVVVIFFDSPFNSYLCVESISQDKCVCASISNKSPLALPTIQHLVHTAINDMYHSFTEYATMVNITHPMIGSVRLRRPKSVSQPLGEIPRTADLLHYLS